MKSLIVLAAAAFCAADALPAQAAWNNVFQPTLFGLFRRPSSTSNYVAPPVVVQSSPVVAYSAPACNTCAPACQPTTSCSTSYVQRCYYQPVTSYQSTSYYEKVTTMQTSYYYEPVTSYRYSCYYDPCTGCPQQVATPVTSYQIRAQSCPVDNWVQRCAQVPVTSYQKVMYWQPQTTCCSTTVGVPVAAAPAPCAPGAPCASAAPAAPPVVNTTPPATNPPPAINENRTPGAGSGSPLYDRYYPPQQQQQPAQQQQHPMGTSFRPQTPAFTPAQPTTPPPPVKLERIVFGPETAVEGQIVRGDKSPRSGAQVLFVNAATGTRETATTNAAGRFQAPLSAGAWLVYLHNTDGTPSYHSRINVAETQPTTVTLVSRN